MSRASSPVASTRMKRSVTIKKGPDSEATSVNGDKKQNKRAATSGPNKGQQADLALDPLFQATVLVPDYFEYNDALTETQINNMRERAIQRAI